MLIRKSLFILGIILYGITIKALAPTSNIINYTELVAMDAEENSPVSIILPTSWLKDHHTTETEPSSFQKHKKKSNNHHLRRTLRKTIAKEDYQKRVRLLSALGTSSTIPEPEPKVVGSVDPQDFYQEYIFQDPNFFPHLEQEELMNCTPSAQETQAEELIYWTLSPQETQASESILDSLPAQQTVSSAPSRQNNQGQIRDSNLQRHTTTSFRSSGESSNSDLLDLQLPSSDILSQQVRTAMSGLEYPNPQTQNQERKHKRLIVLDYMAEDECQHFPTIHYVRESSTQWMVKCAHSECKENRDFSIASYKTHQKDTHGAESLFRSSAKYYFKLDEGKANRKTFYTFSYLEPKYKNKPQEETEPESESEREETSTILEGGSRKRKKTLQPPKVKKRRRINRCNKRRNNPLKDCSQEYIIEEDYPLEMQTEITLGGETFDLWGKGSVNEVEKGLIHNQIARREHLRKKVDICSKKKRLSQEKPKLKEKESSKQKDILVLKVFPEKASTQKETPTKKNTSKEKLSTETVYKKATVRVDDHADIIVNSKTKQEMIMCREGSCREKPSVHLTLKGWLDHIRQTHTDTILLLCKCGEKGCNKLHLSIASLRLHLGLPEVAENIQMTQEDQRWETLSDPDKKIQTDEGVFWYRSSDFTAKEKEKLMETFMYNGESDFLRMDVSNQYNRILQSS